MKGFFEFDRRKKGTVINQVVEQFISYVLDYKLIQGTPLPDLLATKTELGLTDEEIDSILKTLTDKGYLRYVAKKKQYLVQAPSFVYDFIVNVVPAYKEILNSGKKPAVITLEKKEIILDANLAATFKMPVGQKVMRLKRYLTADGNPIFYMDVCFSLDQLPGIQRAFQDDQPHLQIVVQTYPQQYKLHSREISVVTAPPMIQTMLHPKEADMICTFGKYRFFNSKNEVIESGITYMTDLTEYSTTTKNLNDMIL